MSTAFGVEPENLIERACVAVTSTARSKLEEHEAAVERALKAGKEPPRRDVPCASSADWVKWAAAILDEEGLGAWIRDRDLREAFEDLAGPILRRLRDLPEFATWRTETLEIRWSRKPIVIRDIVLDDPVAGRVKVVPPADRETWLGEGDAPAFRLELSLPWWLVASEDEMERGLHAVLAACGMRDDRPVLRKPDIQAHASTLARYGVSGVRQASAVAHAQAHPSHTRLLRSFGFDPDSGQGLLWKDHVVGRQQDLVDQVEAKKRKPKPRPPLRAVEDLSDEPEN